MLVFILHKKKEVQKYNVTDTLSMYCLQIPRKTFGLEQKMAYFYTTVTKKEKGSKIKTDCKLCI